MAPRVSPTERIRAEIHALFDGDVELGAVLEQVARLSVRLTFQGVLEEIVAERQPCPSLPVAGCAAPMTSSAVSVSTGSDRGARKGDVVIPGPPSPRVRPVSQSGPLRRRADTET